LGTGVSDSEQRNAQIAIVGERHRNESLQTLIAEEFTPTDV
jgi:hypothetical protein